MAAMKRIGLAILSLLLFVVPAAAQNILPYVYAVTLGTSSTQVLPANPARKQIVFHNPNAVALVAVCPVGPARAPAGSTITAVINGAGCITILPYDQVTIGAQSSAAPGTPQAVEGVAWVGIASAGSSALTIFEWE